MRKNLLYLLALILLALTVLSTATVYALVSNGPASDRENITYVERDPETVVDALGTSIDVSFHDFDYRDVEPYLEDRSDIKKALVRYYTYDILVNPAPVYWKYYEGNLTKEDIAGLEGIPIQAITYVYYNETSDETYAEFGAYPGVGINPFAFRDVRYALNFLIDREWVSRDLLLGYGEPKYLFIGLKEPMMYYLLDIYLKYRFPYSMYLADNYTTGVLEAVGAERVDGQWYYDGEPINIYFYIRIEDERLTLGNRLADLLENLGFNVTRVYVNYSQVYSEIYSVDPRDQTWHLYTEGWAGGFASIPDTRSIAWFGSAWYGLLPSIDSWEYINETIENLTKQIYNGEYSDFNDYLAKYRLAAEMIIQESIRIWVADLYRVNLYEDYVDGVVKGYSGIMNLYSLRSMNNTLTGTLRIGYPYNYTPLYNPYERNYRYLAFIAHMAVFDPLITVDPITGVLKPFRADYEVIAPSETPSIEVPSDAVTWDAVNNQWVQVGSGVQSVAVVKFNLSNLIGTHWHNNVTITWADVIAAWAYIWEITEDPVKSGLEYQYYKPIIDDIVGLKFDTTNNVLEVYTNYYNKLKPDEIAYRISIIPLEQPLELWEALSYLAFNLSSYALSSERASNEGLPVINLFNSTQASDILSVLEDFYDNATVYSEISKYTTVNGTNYLSYSEFLYRINASRNWISNHSHAVISNGPFYLDTIGENTISLAAFRDPAYPFTPNDFYLEAIQANITNIDIDPVVIGEPAQFNILVEGPDPLTVKYAVKIVGSMEVLVIGDAVHIAPGQYVIDLPATLTETMDNNTLYELVVVAFSKDNNTYDVGVAPIPVGPSAYTEDVVEGGATETIITNTSTSNVSVEVNATSDVSVHVSVFENTNPVPSASETEGAEYTGYAIDIYVNDTDAIVWPIHVEVEYDESALPPGVSEDSLAIYYYNETTHSWSRCSETGVDTVNNIVWANITREEYEAGIGNVFGILGLPPGVGGELVLYNDTIGQGIPLPETIFAILLVAAAIVVVYRKRSEM